jgi:hypothetical protein
MGLEASYIPLVWHKVCIFNKLTSKTSFLAQAKRLYSQLQDKFR